MRPAEARRWHGLVQPVIQNNYVSSTSTASGRVRADWAWNWPRLRARAGLYNLLGSVARWGYVRSLCVVVDGPMHKAVPIGMLAAVPNLETTAFGVTEGRAFTWYLADAPKELYTGVLGMPVLQDVARVLIDCSIQLALDGGGTKVLSFCMPHQLAAPGFSSSTAALVCNNSLVERVRLLRYGFCIAPMSTSFSTMSRLRRSAVHSEDNGSSAAVHGVLVPHDQFCRPCRPTCSGFRPPRN